MMNYQAAFDRQDPERTVRAGVIGTGQYATAIVTQSRTISRLDVPVVADLDPEAARRAFELAGLSGQDIAICESRKAAQQALESGCQVVLSDPSLMMGLPLDVIVESTGDAEAGARHALAAIQHGKHVAMVNKEADAVVGPILKHLADEAGVVYTAVDGDQHGLLMELVAWARELGLEVLAGGKARNAFVLWDEASGAFSFQGQRRPLSLDQARHMGPIPAGQPTEFVQSRAALLGSAGEVDVGAMEELTIAANATGLAPDVEGLHHPVLRTVEIPEVLCPIEDGGILGKRGVIDEVICLCRPHEAHLGGGVFIVIACANDYSRHILTAKGLLSNQRGTAALIYRPYHLCGVETPISMLSAALLGLPTGAADYAPRFDVVARATRNKKAGSRVGIQDLRALMHPAQPVKNGTPLPLRLACGNILAADVLASTLITAEMVARPSGSVLWSIRSQQDELLSSDLPKSAFQRSVRLRA